MPSRLAPQTSTSRPRALHVLLAAGLAACTLAGCESGPSKKPIAAAVMRDVPPLLRGTIGTEVTLNGIEPVLVSGYGLVVDLDDTGGGVLPDRIAAHMEREMALQGISRSEDYGKTPISNRSPRELLRDKRVAVVKVVAAIPPGAPEGSTFDVFVQAINATSLEGGRLWTTDLQIGDALAFGGPQRKELAQARGPVFINPFAEPGSGDDGVTRTMGRVLDGGVVSSPLKIELLMDNPSPQRARAIVSSINSRFPAGPGDQDDTARGRNDSSLALRVPRRYRDEPAAFIQLIAALQIDQGRPETYAKLYSDGMKNEPALAPECALALESIGGDPALRFARTLYDDADPVPRLGALKTGARLGDPRAAGPLIDLARTAHGNERLDAIALLGRVEGGPGVDVALRELMSEKELVIRICAYEAMLERAQRERLAGLFAEERQRAQTTGERRSLSHLETLSKISIPRGGIHGIERILVEGKFFLDIVPLGEPMIYITQQSTPRIVLFGEKLRLQKPLLVSIWSNRLIFSCDSESDPVRMYYRDRRSGAAITKDIETDLPALVAMMARQTTDHDPRLGLNLSYSEVVGVLYALHMQHGLDAAFTTERDKLRAELLEAASTGAKKIRPETEKDREEILVFERPPILTEGAKPEDQSVKPRIVPIPAAKRD